jgi:hypothetical protein
LAACGGHDANVVPQDTHSRGSTARHITIPKTGAALRRTMDANGNLADGGFESGGYTYWQQCGNVNARIQTTYKHSGSYAMTSGSSSKPEINGDAGLCQQITVPANGTLTFWVYQGTNETSTSYAYQEADLLDSSGYVLDNFYTSVANTSGWVKKTVSVASYAGQTVWLYFGVHGNGWSNGDIYQDVDDVAWSTSATPSPSPSQSPTPSPTPTPGGSWPCDNQQFLTYQQEFGNGTLSGDQEVDVCGPVTQVLPSKTTSSGLHGYFYMQVSSGHTIEIVSNLDEMNAPAWPWVAVGDYTYVQGRYYYDNSSSQGIDWTHHGTSSSWPYAGYVVDCNSSGTSCVQYQ